MSNQESAETVRERKLQVEAALRLLRDLSDLPPELEPLRRLIPSGAEPHVVLGGHDMSQIQIRWTPRLELDSSGSEPSNILDRDTPAQHATTRRFRRIPIRGKPLSETVIESRR